MEQTQPISLRVGVKTDRGKVRTENQDKIDRFESPFGQVFIVADGMGGHEGGATAANMLAEGLQRHLRSLSPSLTPAEALQTAASRANAEIYQRANSGDPKTAQMGATSVLALVRGNQVTIAHAGDSRAYLLRDGQLSRLTRDHTVVQRMLDHNMLSPEEARDHPDASVVTRAFGQKPDVELEISAPFELQPGDRLLLCSDGLCGYVDDERIRQVLAHDGDMQAVADALMGLALDAGGEDNVSVQVLTPEGRAVRRGTVAPPPAPAPQRGPSWIFVLLLVLGALVLGVLLTRAWNRWQGGEAGAESADQKDIQSLLAHVPGVTVRAAGEGFEAGRIYFRDNAERKAKEVLRRLRSARPGKRYQLWSQELPPELDEKMQDADVVVVWLAGSSGNANTPPPAASSPAPPPDEPDQGENSSPPLDRNEPPPAEGEPSAAAPTPEKPSISIGPASGEEVAILRHLLSRLTGVGIGIAGPGLQEGRIYFHPGSELLADFVAQKLNAIPGQAKYKPEPWPLQSTGETGVDRVVIIPYKAKGNQ